MLSASEAGSLKWRSCEDFLRHEQETLKAQRCEATLAIIRHVVTSLPEANAPQIDQALQALDPVRRPKRPSQKGVGS